MPMMDITLPEGTLDADARQALVDELTSVLLRAERAPETEFFRSVTWVYAHELPPDAVYTSGRPAEQPIVRLEVTTPEGALSQRRRAELIAEATRVIATALQASPDRVWVLCREIPEGSWGAGGRVVAFRELQEIAAASRSEAATA